jgi:fructoselysine-6-P-deglycase FrlB-like protein
MCRRIAMPALTTANFAKDDVPQDSGLKVIEAELARQFSDALRSFRAQSLGAERVAQDIRGRRRLHLLGIGASHWVNKLAEPAYRSLGVDATAHVISEYMRAPLSGAATRILTSQSGASGEILRYLDCLPPLPLHGLTMTAQSPMAARIPCLVGHGPEERSYAATRSFTVTLALHAAILRALGADTQSVTEALRDPAPLPDLAEAIAALAQAQTVIFCARGPLQGLADGMALMFTELSRRPAQGLEAGMFRHGPFEAVTPEMAVVFLRGQGFEGDNIDGLCAELVAEGLRPLVLDVSGDTPLPETLTVEVTPESGLAAAFRVLPVAQTLIAHAAHRIAPDMGRPLRSTKVTSAETSPLAAE